MTEQLSTSTPKIQLPNKDLVGLKRSEEQKEVTKEKYIGSHIKSKLGDEYASNESYEEYYKDLIWI